MIIDSRFDVGFGIALCLCSGVAYTGLQPSYPCPRPSGRSGPQLHHECWPGLLPQPQSGTPAICGGRTVAGTATAAEVTTPGRAFCVASALSGVGRLQAFGRSAHGWWPTRGLPAGAAARLLRSHTAFGPIHREVGWASSVGGSAVGQAGVVTCDNGTIPSVSKFAIRGPGSIPG